jgi:pilus assembly protein CpaE
MILLASTSPTVEERIRMAFRGKLNGDLRRARDDRFLSDPNAVLLALNEQPPDVVALGPDVPIDIALDLAGRLDRELPSVSVVLIAQPTPELWRRAMRAGVRDVVSPDAPDEEIRQVFDAAQASSGRHVPIDTTGGGPSGPKGRVITVTSPKGGSGKTAVASNLGVGLAQATGVEVVIVDLDLQFGDMTHVLGLQPEHTFSDADNVGGALDLTTLKVFLTPRKGGTYVLCAPDSPAEGEMISTDNVARTIGLLAAEFPYVVVDTSAGLTEHTLTAIERSTDLLLVCDLSMSSIMAMRKVTDALDQLEMTRAERHFILNRAATRVGIDESEVISVVGMGIDIGIPSNRAVPLSMNQGVPLIESTPRSPVTKKLVEIVDRFADVTAERSAA